MKQYKVRIRANPAYPFYMQHRMLDGELEKWEKKRGKIIEREDVHQKDDFKARSCAYINNKGKFYIPSEHIRGALVNAGSFVKAKVGNSRKSMTNIVAGMFYVMPEELPIHQEYSVDKRSAVNQNIKARIVTYRPKWANWQTEFILSVDNDTITHETIQEILLYAGSYVGIGSFRPQHKGQFGRFIVDKFEEI